ncbi:hypothetical protein F5J12DRAFT_235083 [Pisolithus orientalis]|uniref:uncharacterized protein n=1 Tax=Pisolithus orientalis TaxID=936130 RepID=UPI0022249A87|nr:uncharacterized protein F5J12DRAFT_235083 [Pisolithus orientalis]KAI6001536.1 hypothetical protein F5J12DRAFT_235083 [Pisolithus orientalis]
MDQDFARLRRYRGSLWLVFGISSGHVGAHNGTSYTRPFRVRRTNGYFQCHYGTWRFDRFPDIRCFAYKQLHLVERRGIHWSKQ